MAMKAVVEKQKLVARRIFDSIKGQDTIYDAQTVVNSLSGYIKYELAIKEAGLKLNDLLIDLKNEPKTKITEAIEMLKVELQDESARDMATLLERFGNTLGQYSAAKHLKTQMNEVKLEDIVAA